MNRSPRSDPRLSALAQVAVFRACTPDDLAHLLPDTDVIDIDAGTVIDRSGTFARQFVGIVDGYVEALDENGNSTVLGPGDQFGAIELFDRSAHRATHTTLTLASLVVVFGPRFRAEARRMPAVAFQAMRTARRRPSNELTLVG